MAEIESYFFIFQSQALIRYWYCTWCESITEWLVGFNACFGVGKCLEGHGPLAFKKNHPAFNHPAVPLLSSQFFYFFNFNFFSLFFYIFYLMTEIESCFFIFQSQPLIRYCTSCESITEWLVVFNACFGVGKCLEGHGPWLLKRNHPAFNHPAVPPLPSQFF